MDGLRKALLLSHVPLVNIPDGPGVLILSEDISIMATTPTAEYWLLELAEMEKVGSYPLPFPVRSVVAKLKAVEDGQAIAIT